MPHLKCVNDNFEIINKKSWYNLCKLHWTDEILQDSKLSDPKQSLNIDWKPVFCDFCFKIREKAEQYFKEAEAMSPDREMQDQISETVKIWKKKLEKKLEERSLRELFEKIPFVKQGVRRKQLIWDFWKMSRKLNRKESFHTTISWDQLRVAESLGVGTVGEVFAGTWKSKKVAIKVVHVQKQEDEQLLTTEIVLLSILKHRYLKKKKKKKETYKCQSSNE